jgi:hypothetical protein
MEHLPENVTKRDYTLHCQAGRLKMETITRGLLDMGHYVENQNYECNEIFCKGTLLYINAATLTP